jgi:hypothetical protein
MKNNFGFIFIGFVIIIAGCSSGKIKQSGLTFFNDFESIKGWECDMSRISDAKAHSGSYSAFTDSAHQFSYTFKMLFKNISNDHIKGVNYRVWCYAEALPVNATVVASIKSNTVNPIFWNGNNIEDYINEPQKWIEISGHLDFDSKAVAPDNEFGFYLQNTGKAAVYADDFELEFIK